MPYSSGELFFKVTYPVSDPEKFRGEYDEIMEPLISTVDFSNKIRAHYKSPPID